MLPEIWVFPVSSWLSATQTDWNGLLMLNLSVRRELLMAGLKHAFSICSSASRSLSVASLMNAGIYPNYIVSRGPFIRSWRGVSGMAT